LAVDGGAPVRATSLPLIRASFDQRERAQIESVFDAGVFCSVMPEAEKVAQLESAFAKYAESAYAVAFSSGTTAQHASLAAIGIGPGDEVIVPPLTFASTAYTVLLQGGTVVFADVVEDTLTLDPAKVKEQITSRTKAVVPVHWFGHPVDMDPLMEMSAERHLSVIEDCAHAYGTKYKGRRAGGTGDAACWSLQESKLITAGGEGGMLTTDDDRLAETARATRDHGKSQEYRPLDVGYLIDRLGNNYRMTEFQAAFALAQLEKVDEFITRRRAHSDYLDSAFTGIPLIRRPAIHDYASHGCPYYPIRFSEKAFTVDLNGISAALTAEGIGNYPIGRDELATSHPLLNKNRHAGAARLVASEVPVAEKIARELLLLPLYPDLELKDLDDIIEAVFKVVGAYRI
jgi:perosamine synthetase